MVTSRWFFRSQLKIRTNVISPTTAPKATRAKVRKSRWFTAPRTYSYFPMRTRIKEPEMPGRIMAQMATAPLRMRNHGDSGVDRGTMPTSQYAPIVPRIMQPAVAMRHRSKWRPTVKTEARTRPKKKDQIKTGRFSKSQPRILASEKTAVNMPKNKAARNGQATPLRASLMLRPNKRLRKRMSKERMAAMSSS